MTDKVTLGGFSYFHQETAISGTGVAEVGQVILAPSIWNNPLIKSMMDSIFNMLFGGG